MIITMLINKLQVSSYNLWKFECITFSIKNLMVLLTSAILGARTADRPADGTFFLQKKNYRMAKTWLIFKMKEVLDRHKYDK